MIRAFEFGSQCVVSVFRGCLLSVNAGLISKSYIVDYKIWYCDLNVMYKAFK